MTRHVITFHYTLTDKAGKILDQSEKGRPLIFLSGSGQIIPGLESILTAMDTGAKTTVTVPAKDAYGAHNSQMIHKVARKELPSQDIRVGEMFEVGQGGQFFPVTITAIDGDQITLDGNHPLAGQDLTFAVEIAAKRPATADEISHGHAHGASGCHH